MRRVIALIAIFLGCAVAWLALAGVTRARSYGQAGGLRGDVAELWGSPQRQSAPSLTFHWVTDELREEQRVVEGKPTVVTRRVQVPHQLERHVASTVGHAALRLDLRRKGLIWFPLYDVDFQATWTYVHARPEAGELEIALPFPDQSGVYDGFRFVLDGQPLALQPSGGRVVHRVAVQPGQRLALEVAYRTRGMDTWQYQPGEGVSRLQAFDFSVDTDFAAIDFPMMTLSPTEKTVNERGGWRLRWTFEQAVTGMGLGMVVPSRLQPGELASALAESAPVSLFFFFLVLFVLDTLRGIGMHPMNYAFLAGAFFAFHLLFAYSADHLPVEGAFALASAVSLGLVVTYLRLVVGNRFAFVEAAAAQLVYLVGFSLAHFWAGYTGLTITVLAIVTLFALMQWTGRVDWAQALARKPRAPRQVAPA
ncbi:MAG: inner membrane CreD family protein [Myxococcales bacterium]|nr:inner membrane CreD family protein [Myxococcales bacterium]MCB9526299.1 inner membrane CreD family protein [Myxococcales bacterium]